MLNQLFQQLRKTPEGNLFNPWYDFDSEHELSATGPKIRRRQLQTYFEERLGKARYLCIAEALGYQGGHFTGIAMTSERILLGHHEKKNGIAPDHVFREVEPERTSKPEVNQNGFSEPTATIMWKALNQLDIDPYQVVLWNALPWHPYKAEQGLLSNRTPTDNELQQGYEVLKTFRKIYPEARLIAVGKKSVASLNTLNWNFDEVRHPANGGAPKFRRQMKEIANRYE